MKTTKTMFAALAAFALFAAPACGEQEAKKEDKKEEKKADEPKDEAKDPPKEEPKNEPAAGGGELGVPECDELIKKTRCMWEKTEAMAPGSVPEEAKKAFEEGIEAWKTALATPETKDLTIETCKTSLENGKAAWESLGC